jgi:hypothetical protein
MEPVQAAAVRSPDFEKVFFIAVRFTVTGVDDPVVGVWASNSLKPGGGLIMSVDNVAQEFSDWGAAEETDAAIDPADPATDAAAACV